MTHIRILTSSRQRQIEQVKMGPWARTGSPAMES